MEVKNSHAINLEWNLCELFIWNSCEHLPAVKYHMKSSMELNMIRFTNIFMKFFMFKKL